MSASEVTRHLNLAHLHNSKSQPTSVLHSLPSLWYCVISNRKQTKTSSAIFLCHLAEGRWRKRMRRAGGRIFLDVMASRLTDCSHCMDEEPL
jgi:hypothetical protein